MKKLNLDPINVGAGVAILALVMALVMGLTKSCQGQVCPNAPVPEKFWQQSDKQLHFMASGAIFTMSEQMLFHTNQRNTNLKALAITLTIGAGKELIYDKWMGRGNADPQDVPANCIGIAVFGGVNYTLNKFMGRDKRNRIFYRNGLVAIRLNK